MEQNEALFQQSVTGAHSAWKGFYSQTLYISNRILKDQDCYTYFPEDIEDLIIKDSDNIVEAVQIKDISSNLSLSSLASTKSSRNAEGFFNRMASLHKQFPDFGHIHIVYFGTLGPDLIKLEAGNSDIKAKLKQKLITCHGLNELDADWLLVAIKFEHAAIYELEESINSQIRKFSPIQAAPDLAKSLLIQYISELSRNNGNITNSLWKEKMYQIGTDIAAIDGYFKEYNKSIIRIKELKSSKTSDELRHEFSQGISVHPSHIRMNLDFPRKEWISKIQTAMAKNGAVIVKGVSGQGKSSICYRYLLDMYEEDLIFCIRSIKSFTQAENLVVALAGLEKHTQELVVYIDVSSGETRWVYFLQELQSRGIHIPVLVAIRDEDFNMTPINGVQIQFNLIELTLSIDEARQIYLNYTQAVPHSQHRSFDEAWKKFGEHGPLLEFMYLLSNNLTLSVRLHDQIKEMLRAKMQDSWLQMLQTVCFAGRIGSPLRLLQLKQIVDCDNFYSAIERFRDEYLIKISDDGEFIEALHPVRAKIIDEILKSYIGNNPETKLINVLKCAESNYVQILLLEYFSLYNYSDQLIDAISKIPLSSWIAFSGILRAMLWLDVKRYIEKNNSSISQIIKDKGEGWITFMPNDISGLIHNNKIFAEDMIELIPEGRKEDFKTDTINIKNSFSSLQIDYKLTDSYLYHSVPPMNCPQNDEEWTAFGYSLFWYAKRGISIGQLISKEQIWEGMKFGDIQSRAFAIRGLSEQSNYIEFIEEAKRILIARIIEKYCVIVFKIDSDSVCCKFVPPIFSDKPENTTVTSNFNHFWVIKILTILEHVFPEKEYIEIELLGVNMLSDLGIQPIDHKVRIPKKNRPISWITELNSWSITRIEYASRPDSWIDYIKLIDEMHKVADRFVVWLTQCLDPFYKRYRLDQDKWECVTSGYAELSGIFTRNPLLPKSVVDSYCLYREGQRKEFQGDMKELVAPIEQLLSLSVYDEFRKSNQETLNSLINFANHFGPILHARIEKKPIDVGINHNLAIFNLFDATKGLSKFSDEYHKLFSNYSTLDNKFHEQELLHLLILLNLWQHVSKLPPQGFSILPLARQRLSRSENYLKQGFLKFIKKNDVKVISSGNQEFFLVEFDFSNENTIQNEYTRVVLDLRKALLEAIPLRSERYCLETKYPALVYVPTYNGVPFASGFSIPIYKLLDAKDDDIASSLFPVELPTELNKSLDTKNELLDQLIDEGISAIAQVQSIFSHYNSVIGEINSDLCMIGLEAYLKDLNEILSQAIEKIPRTLLEIQIHKPGIISNDGIRSLKNLISLLESVETTIASHIPIEAGSVDVVSTCITELLMLKCEW